jgi:hypothetical protein
MPPKTVAAIAAARHKLRDFNFSYAFRSGFVPWLGHYARHGDIAEPLICLDISGCCFLFQKSII